ncbi:MAG TPA: DEAD/DEAH box helicase, partial [Planctomycetota bacterium]|nr:DEAD/DEAH box helicase [Planctomycetota bacterium]
QCLKAGLADDADLLQLNLTAHRLHLCARYDRLVSLAGARTNIEPYQIAAVAKVIGAFRQRYMIADDVGLGKTIEAGMIFQELAVRGRAERALIVCPAPLTDQWQDEMKSRFGAHFEIVDSSAVRSMRKRRYSEDANPWEMRNRLIVSIDYAKRDEVLAELGLATWDLVIIDEAHRMSVTSDIGTIPTGPQSNAAQAAAAAKMTAAAAAQANIQTTARYRLGEKLSQRTDALILLTATPHKGDRLGFYRLLALLDPYMFENDGSLTPKRLGQVMIRRGKDELKDAQGRPIFRPRVVQSVPIDFSPGEKALYDNLTAYVREGYTIAGQKGNHAAGFAMILLQRRFTSSLDALQISLTRRLEHLQGRAKKAGVARRHSGRNNRVSGRSSGRISSRVSGRSTSPASGRLIPGSDGAQRLRALRNSVAEKGGPVVYGIGEDIDAYDEQLEVESAAADRAELDGEIARVEGLLLEVKALGLDSKARALREFVQGLLARDPNEKVIIFTEFADTMRYLQNTVLKGIASVSIHGALNRDERLAARARFKDENCNILVATDAAGEGLNLQFCHLLINYDMPWNPNRIDQRIGRVHRYGQKRDCHIYNLHVRGTREGDVFLRLQAKVDLIEKDLGGRISDVLGTLLENFDIERSLTEATVRNVDLEAMVGAMDQEIEKRRAMIEQMRHTLLMDFQGFDLGEAVKIQELSERTSPAQAEIQAFVTRAFTLAGGKIRPAPGRNPKLFEFLPPHSFAAAGQNFERKSFVATFDREAAKADPSLRYISHGDELLKTLIDWVRAGNFGQTGGRVHVQRLAGGSGRQPKLRLPGTGGGAAAGTGAAGSRKRAVTAWCLGQFVDGHGKVAVEELIQVELELKASLGPGKPVPERLRFQTEPLEQKIREAGNAQVARRLAEIQSRKAAEQATLLKELERHAEARLAQYEEKLTNFGQRIKHGDGLQLHVKRVEKERRQFVESINARREQLQALGTITAKPLELLALDVAH